MYVDPTGTFFESFCNHIKDFLHETFGLGVVQTQKYDTSEWWKIWEYKIGVQINIGTGGYAYEIGIGERSFTIAANNKSLEFIVGVNKVGFTGRYSVDFSNRTSVGVFTHIYARTLPVAGAIALAYVTGGAIIPTLIPMVQGVI